MKKFLYVLSLVVIGIGGYSFGVSKVMYDNKPSVHKVSYSYDHDLYNILQNELTKGSSYYDCKYIMTAFDLDYSQTNKIEDKLLECYDKDSQFNKELRGAVSYWSSDNNVKEAAQKIKENQFPNDKRVTTKKLENILNYAENN